LGKANKPQRIFGTVRAFSERGTMLSKHDLESFSDSKTLEEFVTRLKNTSYVDSLSKIQQPITSEKIEIALREDLFNFHSSMAKIAKGDLVNAYYKKYILWNLKIILKSKALGKTYDDIFPHINMQAEELIGRRDIIIKALVAKDLDETVSALQTSEFGNEISSAAQLYKENNNIQIFELYLDKIYYKGLVSAFANIGKPADLQPLVSLDLDYYNVLSTIRAKYWKLPEEHIKSLRIATTSRVNEDVLNKMIHADSVKQAIAEFSKTVYKDIVLNQGNESDNAIISQIESSFEELIHRKSMALYGRMFSYAPMTAAIKLKMTEIKNLVAIAFGIEQKMDPKNIIDRLLLV
jgi:V/A-type H+-transporting ATPase subunit C